ncbi:hypothetical protein ADL04_09525, partial [Streptomyces sp. NRRL B-3648]
PEGFLKGAAELGVDPADCVVFEDSGAGIAAGRSPGVAVGGGGARGGFPEPGVGGEAPPRGGGASPCRQAPAGWTWAEPPRARRSAAAASGGSLDPRRVWQSSGDS